MSAFYFKEYRSKDGTILSVDMLTVNGKFYGRPDDVGFRFWSLIRPVIFLDYTEWTSYKFGSYRYQYTVTCENDCSFWFGIGFNSPSEPFPETCNKWRIEFNPNKVFKEYLFLKTYLSFIQLSKHIEIKRFDVAIDYPVSRSCCFLVKDGRTYSEYCNSIEDRTQNLGQHSHHGYVKLYNKQIESKLPIPLTRLELTVDYKKRGFSDLKQIFPKVYIVNDFQMKIDNAKLNDTDTFILCTCLENPNSLKMLGRGKRKKIESIITEYSRFLKIDKKSYNHILTTLSEFVNIDTLFNYLPEIKEEVKKNEFYKSDDFIDLSPLEYDEVIKVFGGDNLES